FLCPPLVPPDPPDPSSLLLSQFPPLSPPVTQKSQSSPQIAHVMVPEEVSVAEIPTATTVVEIPTVTTEIEMPQSETASPEASKPSIAKTRSETTVPEKFTILVPKSTSPLQTNTALNIPHPPQAAAIHPPSSAQTTSATSLPQTAARPSAPQPPSEPHTNISQTTVPPSLVERIRVFEDRSLRRLAPVTISETGRPRVLIPDEVFQRGEELHKDFIVCYFNGRPPPYSQIQSVLNHLWGKGGKLEIHNNLISRNMIVRIPSDYLRKKILEKGFWYVRDSMFHTAQWSSAHSAESPPLDAIQIWAHLTGISLNLRHQKGLSLVAGLVGEPVETDEFTKNLVSHTLSHVKVEVNLTKELPRVVEFQRQSGEVVEVLVDYPWLPPTCSHCKELGHIVRNCLKVPLPPRTTNATPKAQVARGAKKKNVSSDQDTVFQQAHDLPNNKKNKEAASTSSTPDVVSNSENHPPVTPVSHSAILTARIPFPRSSSLPSLVLTTVPVVIALPATITPTGEPYPYSPPENEKKATLKRSRSNPSLNTSLSLNSHRLVSKLCHGWSFTSNHSSDENGRIILIWRDPAKVRILHQSRQTLTCEMGLFDFEVSRPILYVDQLLLVNCHALSMFPNSTATFLPLLTSDHSPCLVDLAHQLPKAGTRPFKFYNYLTKHPNFHHLLQEAWFQAGSFGFTLTILCWKQKTIKRALKELNRENFSQIQVRVCEAYSLLQVVQSILAPDILPSMSISSPPDWFQSLSSFRACCLKLIWLIFFQSGSMWVAWYKSVVLKGSLNNFWTAKPHRKHSWLANKLLKVREDMFPWIKLRLGNGNNCRFWSDNWSPFGSIKSFIHSRRGIPENAILSSLHHQGQWMLPSARSESEVSLQAYLTTIDLTAEDDYYEWIIDDQVSEKDQILGWGLQTDANCLLCNSCDESMKHILFDCAFSWDIWMEVERRSNLQACRVWGDSILQMQSLWGGKHANRLTLLGWQATIYWIWAERNARLHQQNFRSTETLITLIDRQIRNKIASFREKNPAAAIMALDGDL
ncbi:unnamed protein product, partial [Thlaspi arvense]